MTEQAPKIVVAAIRQRLDEFNPQDGFQNAGAFGGYDPIIDLRHDTWIKPIEFFAQHVEPTGATSALLSVISNRLKLALDSAKDWIGKPLLGDGPPPKMFEVLDKAAETVQKRFDEVERKKFEEDD